ncbi:MULTISPECIES: hypothetical protein [Pseudomonas]|uniref:hypothetical protein n=1 Tax=Pseudomonas TaxID=286 RepID=UPI00235F27A0|nr:MULTISPECIES: hypothetical protein [Pseudomonas]WJV25611.1 hypothetical protein PSR66_06105 [Pseudomonas chlororaphis]
MHDFLMSLWELIADLPVSLGWAVIGGFVTAIVGALVSLWNTRRTLAVQRLANTRSVSTFIADKRQKWIDDLRSDIAKYLSLSLETAEAWKQLYWKCGDRHDRYWGQDPQAVVDECEALRIVFLKDNTTRASEHHQLYMRVVLRLNDDEKLHQALTISLRQLRTNMDDLAVAALRGNYANQPLFEAIQATLNDAEFFTKAILKEEWQRLKREVAEPNRLIKDILNIKVPSNAALRDSQSSAPGVASALSSETPSSVKASA